MIKLNKTYIEKQKNVIEVLNKSQQSHYVISLGSLIIIFVTEIAFLNFAILFNLKNNVKLLLLCLFTNVYIVIILVA